MAKNYEIDMTRGSLLPKIVKFCIPLILTNLLQVFYNAADIIVAGRFAGGHAIAAIGSSGHIFNLFTNFFIGMSLGSNVVIAQQVGSGDNEGAKKTIHTSVALSAVFGLMIAVVGFFLSREILVLTNCNADVIDQAALYLKILFLGMPAQMIYNYCAAILRSVGDTKHPLTYLSISGAVNVVLNVIMVVCFKRAADGVAIATVISQYLSLILIVRFLTKQKGICRLEIKRLRFHFESLKRILIIGLPSGIQSTTFSLSNVIIQSSVNSFGTAVVAGNAASSNIEAFLFTAIDSVAAAALAFTGQNVGAKRVDRIKRVLQDCVLVDIIICSLLGTLAFVFAKQALSIYLPNLPKAVEAGSIRLMIFAASMIIGGIMNALTRTCNGMGKSLGAMIISIIGVCVFRIVWVYTVLPLSNTFFTLMISYPITWSITAFITFLYYLHCKKTLQIKFEKETKI